MLQVFVASNVAIAVAYLVLGLYVSPRFNLAGNAVGVKITKYAMLAFFLFCAATHVEMVIHVLTEPRAKAWMLAGHMIFIHVAQAVAAPVAALTTWRFLQISILPRTAAIDVTHIVELEVKQRSLALITLCIAQAFIIVVAAITVFALSQRSSAIFNPLVLPIQRTNATVYHLGDLVIVEATKCNGSHQTVAFQGSISWVTINPAGTVVPVQSGVGTAAPGCITSTFANAMPPGVIAATQAFFDRGIEPVTWRLAGSETPLGHLHSVATGYVTNNFTIAP